MVEIRVNGRDEHSAAAEIGEVFVDVSAWDDVQTAAAERAVSVHNGLLAEAEAFRGAGAVETIAADPVVVTRQEQRDQNGMPTGDIRFIASSRVRVAFGDRAALAEWLGVLVLRDDVETSHVSWSLRPETEKELTVQARRGAVADAVRRAKDYAEAAGLGTPGLDAIVESGAEAPTVRTESFGGVRHSRAMAAMADTSSAGIEPAEIEVRASITAVFTA